MAKRIWEIDASAETCIQIQSLCIWLIVDRRIDKEMKALATILLALAVLAAPAYSQTTATGSASGNASVANGQAGANVNTSEQTRANGASASTTAAGSAQVKEQHEARPEKHESHAKDRGDRGNSHDQDSLSAALASGATLQAELTKPVDAKKAKPGDPVSAKLTQDVKSNGHVVLHKGSKLAGHVTEAQARGKGQAESKLGIVFDKAQLKGGEEASINAVIQALAPPARATALAGADEAGSLSAPMGGAAPAAGGGGLVGGVTRGATSTLGGATGSVSNVGGGAVGSVNSTLNGAAGTAAGGLNAQGTLMTTSRGVIGLQGLTLNSVSTAGAQASVISSATQNVKLESGTQMLLQSSGASK